MDKFTNSVFSSSNRVIGSFQPSILPAEFVDLDDEPIDEGTIPSFIKETIDKSVEINLATN
jgi:hypothetical protein